MQTNQTDTTYDLWLDVATIATGFVIDAGEEIFITKIKKYIDDGIDEIESDFLYDGNTLLLPASFAQGIHLVEVETKFNCQGIYLEGANLDKINSVNVIEAVANDYDETNAREIADESLSKSLSLEISARQAAEEMLAASISESIIALVSEIEARGNEDAELNKIINEEVQRAETAETALSTEIAGKQSTLTFDSAPTANSANPVTSAGIKSALDAKQSALTFDSTPTSGSTNPVTSTGIKSALDVKQSALTFDSTPTSGSNNPVTSGGLFTAFQNAGGGIPSAISLAPDFPPAIPNAMDDEFTASSLNAKWTVVNQGTQTFNYRNSAIIKETSSGTSAENVVAFVQGVPSGNWEFRAKYMYGYNGHVGLVLRDSAGKLAFLRIIPSGAFGSFTLYWSYYSSPTVWNSNPNNMSIIAGGILYLRIIYNGTTLNISLSANGWTWYNWFSVSPTAYLSALYQIGFAFNCNTNTSIQDSGCDWFRRIS